MKQNILTLALIMTLAATSWATAEHKHDDKPIAGPQGGRVIEVASLHAEFLVTPERKASVRFYDEAMNPVAATEQAVTLIAEAPTGKAKLEFKNQDGVLISKANLPDGDGYNLVLQVKLKAEAAPQNFRIPLHLEICEKCKRAEYACICEDAGSEGHGHSHGH